MKFLILCVCIIAIFAENTSVGFTENEVEIVRPPNGATLEATSDLNVRDKPCTDGRVITSIKQGGRVAFTNNVQNGCNYQWFSVSGSFGNGWAASNWLKVASQGAQQINQRGLNLIKEFEGLRLCKYKDPVGIWTICYGHVLANPDRVNCVSQQECDRILREDVRRFEQCVNSNVKVPINSNQFSSLVSFSFNVGCGALQGSTLLRQLNARNYGQVCPELKKWVNGGGRRLPGLVRRRDAECALFSS